MIGYTVSGLVGAGVFFLVGLAMSVLFVPWAWRKQIDRRIAMEVAGLSNGAVGAQSFDLADDTIRWATAAVDALWQRSAIRGIEVTDDHAYVILSRSGALILPLQPDLDGVRWRLVEELRQRA